MAKGKPFFSKFYYNISNNNFIYVTAIISVLKQLKKNMLEAKDNYNFKLNKPLFFPSVWGI